MRRPLLVLLVLLLCGCVDRLAQRQAVLSRFVGHPEKELVEAIGVPNRTYETGGEKFPAYDENRLQVLPSPYGPVPWWWYGGGPPQFVELRCETTFAITGGVVKSFTLRGNACG